MRKLLIVARHEYLTNLLRKGFLLATFVLPLLLAIGFLLLLLIAVRAGLRAEMVTALGYVDQAGLLHALDREVITRSELGPDIPIRRYANEAAARAALEDGAIDAYFVVPADYLTTGSVTGYALERLPLLGQRHFEQLLYRGLREQAPANEPRIDLPVAETVHRVIGAPEPRPAPGIQQLLLPVVFAGLFLWTVFFASNYLIQGLVEEKENRLMEILASSLRPGELMGGKILGLGLLGLTQLVVWLTGIVVALKVAASLSLTANAVAPSAPLLLLMLVLFLGGYLLFAATLSAIGAMTSATQEGSQLAGFVTLLALVPIWFVSRLAEQPGSALSVGLSLFPYTAPVSLLLRMAGGPLPWWQIALAVTLLLSSAAGTVWVAGRVMRYSMLRYGQKVGLRELARALRRASS